MIANGVILADNDALMRSLIRSVLLRAELQVFPVANGQEAVALAGQFTARLVLLDIAMPHLNGLLACKAIHALPGYARVPIVMLTGYGDARIRAAAAEFGAIDFITKPVQPDALLARLATHLDMPAHLLEVVAAARNGANALPGSRAQVWAVPPDPKPPTGERADLVDGRETMRIVRGADRRA